MASAGVAQRLSGEPFARYEEVTTESKDETMNVRKGTLGCALGIYQSEITAGRLVLDASRRKGGQAFTNAALLNLLWSF